VTALFIKTVQSGYDQNDDKDDKNNRSKFSRDGLERSYCEICCKFRKCHNRKSADCAEKLPVASYQFPERDKNRI
jgi:hypothetical protein